uniref:Centrosomal protein 68 n=1 Tax=Strix occidentalis caurina TaxID=311401 RepID=A0A8D0FV94_STROC
MESVATSRCGHLVTGVTQGGSSYRQEASSASASRFPRARTSLSETETLIYRAADGGDVPRHVSRRFLSSEEQQVRGLYVQGLLRHRQVPAKVGTSVASVPVLPPWSRAPRPPKPFGPLLDNRPTAERIRGMSSYQADYWACAIPDSLPPSPDRHSPHWNPNKEYEDLLDYAYPLKPRYKLGKMPEPFLHDSGIGLDSFSVSPEGTSRSTSIYGRGGQARGSGENGRWGFVASAERFSTPTPGKRGCSGAGSSYEPSAAAKTSFTKSTSSCPSRGFAKDVMKESAGPGSFGHPAADGRSWRTRGSPFPNYKGQAKSTNNRFLPTTQVLPLRQEWESDEEFLSLPPRLQELESLAQFLTDLSLTIRMPRHNDRDLPRHSDSRQPLSSVLAPFREAGGRDERGNIEDCAGLQHPCSSQKPSWGNTESCGQIHRDPRWRLHLPTGLRDTLDGTYLHEPRVKGHLKKSQQSESLAQCIKMFCCQLEELIRWLYNVADITDSWVPPSPDTETVLFPSQEFRKDVADHRSLTESVLERGEALLDCMASNSPALKDTLGLIAKQSEELETHAEHLITLAPTTTTLLLRLAQAVDFPMAHSTARLKIQSAKRKNYFQCFRGE